jgi:hypothetical protein
VPNNGMHPTRDALPAININLAGGRVMPGVRSHSMKQPKELDELQELARNSTRRALEEYEPIPAEWEKHLTLGTVFDGEDRVFELYVAGESPSDAIVISSARVNRKNRSVQVIITNLKKKNAS